MRKFELYQAVVLEHALNPPDVKSRLESGAPGIIVDLLNPDGVAVEFFDKGGKTIEVAFIPESFVRPATKAETKASRSR